MKTELRIGQSIFLIATSVGYKKITADAISNGSHLGSHGFAGANQTPVRFVQPLSLFDNGFYFAWGFADVWIW